MCQAFLFFVLSTHPMSTNRPRFDVQAGHQLSRRVCHGPTMLGTFRLNGDCEAGRRLSSSQTLQRACITGGADGLSATLSKCGF